MWETITELSPGAITVIVFAIVGIIFSIIKKMLKIAILILSMGVLLYVIIKLASGYLNM